MLVKYVVHASKSIVFTQRGVSCHGTAGLCHRRGHQTARRPASRSKGEQMQSHTRSSNTGRSEAHRSRSPVLLHRDKTDRSNVTAEAGGESGDLFWLPLIINSSVHLGLQLVGASADRSAVTTSPLGTRILLKVLSKKTWIGVLKTDKTTSIGVGRNRSTQIIIYYSNYS